MQKRLKYTALHKTRFSRQIHRDGGGRRVEDGEREQRRKTHPKINVEGNREMAGRGEEGMRGGWFVTVDGNAHVERHVRRRRRGGRVRRGAAGGRDGRGDGARGRRGLHLVRELTGGCCIDRRERAG